MKRTLIWILAVALCSAPIGVIVLAQTSKQAAVPQIKWQDILRQTPEWYASHEAVRIADNVLAFQRDEGGWPKNMDMARALMSGRADVLRQRQI
jgi:hypothetical protein